MPIPVSWMSLGQFCVTEAKRYEMTYNLFQHVLPHKTGWWHANCLFRKLCGMCQPIIDAEEMFSTGPVCQLPEQVIETWVLKRSRITSSKVKNCSSQRARAKTRIYKEMLTKLQGRNEAYKRGKQGPWRKVVTLWKHARLQIGKTKPPWILSGKACEGQQKGPLQIYEQQQQKKVS